MCVRAVLLVLLLTAAAAQAAPASPEGKAVEATLGAFYGWVLAHPSRALPSAKERVQLSKVLSPQLIQLLSDASATEARCVKAAAKDEKPDIVEGDLFVGNYEGASEVAYGEARRDGDTVVVPTSLMYVDRRYAKGHKFRALAWNDEVRLRQEGGRWVVADVLLNKQRTLSAALNEYIADGAKQCPQR